MSAVGSAATIRRSATFPASTVPRSLPSGPSASAPVRVEATSTSIGVMPAPCIASISAYTDGPASVSGFPASVPMATGMPAARTRLRFSAITARAAFTPASLGSIRCLTGAGSFGSEAVSATCASVTASTHPLGSSTAGALCVKKALYIFA